MPKPRYIICSLDRLVDQATGAVTHVNVVEKFMIKEERAPEPPPGIQYLVARFPLLKMILTAVWARDKDDLDTDDIEFEARLHKPDEDEAILLQKGEFRFPAGTSYFRIDSGIIITSDSRFKRSGTVILENRARKRGSEKWLVQEFPMEVEVVQVELAQPENNTAAANQ